MGNATWKKGQKKPGRPATLSAAFVRTVTEPGRYGDGRGGHGLSLLVKRMQNGRTSRSWSQRIIIGGKVRNIGLGSYPRLGLADARARALANAKEVELGRDPRGGGIPTFEKASEEVLAVYAPNWRGGERSVMQWRSSLKTYAFPSLGQRRLNEIQVQHVLEALLPIWHEKPETARKVRQRVSTVMRWAVAQGHRQDDPAGPAINAALPRAGNDKKHYRALPYRDVAAALATVDASQAWQATKLCFRFLVLTAVRSGEARGARWDEIDLDKRSWHVPAARTKTNAEHRVPLSDAAVAVLEAARAAYGGEGLVFPAPRGRAISDATLLKLLRTNGVDSTVHGMRSSFRDWCAETGQPRELAEQALAHVVAGIEGAYFRSDLYKRRVKLMQEWANYLNS